MNNKEMKKIKKVTTTIVRVMRSIKKCDGRRLTACARALKRAGVSEETITKIVYWACDDMRYCLLCQAEEDAEIEKAWMHYMYPQNTVRDPVKEAEKWAFAHGASQQHLINKSLIDNLKLYYGN